MNFKLKLSFSRHSHLYDVAGYSCDAECFDWLWTCEHDVVSFDWSGTCSLLYVLLVYSICFHAALFSTQLCFILFVKTTHFLNFYYFPYEYGIVVYYACSYQNQFYVQIVLYKAVLIVCLYII